MERALYCERVSSELRCGVPDQSSQHGLVALSRLMTLIDSELVKSVVRRNGPGMTFESLPGRDLHLSEMGHRDVAAELHLSATG